MANDLTNRAVSLRKGGERNYMPVSARLVAFRTDHPDFGIKTEALKVDTEGGFALFHCEIRDAGERVLATAHGTETMRDFPDFIEKAETKSVGRALVLLGYGTDAAGYELDEGERLADSPVAPVAPAPASAQPAASSAPINPVRESLELVREFVAACTDRKLTDRIKGGTPGDSRAFVIAFAAAVVGRAPEWLKEKFQGEKVMTPAFIREAIAALPAWDERTRAEAEDMGEPVQSAAAAGALEPADLDTAPTAVVPAEGDNLDDPFAA